MMTFYYLYPPSAWRVTFLLLAEQDLGRMNPGYDRQSVRIHLLRFQQQLADTDAADSIRSNGNEREFFRLITPVVWVIRVERQD